MRFIALVALAASAGACVEPVHETWKLELDAAAVDAARQPCPFDALDLELRNHGDGDVGGSMVSGRESMQVVTAPTGTHVTIVDEGHVGWANDRLEIEISVQRKPRPSAWPDILEGSIRITGSWAHQSCDVTAPVAGTVLESDPETPPRYHRCGDGDDTCAVDWSLSLR